MAGAPLNPQAGAALGGIGVGMGRAQKNAENADFIAKIGVNPAC